MIQKTIKQLPKSELAIEVSIPTELFEAYRPKALEHAGEHIEIAGFRKGKAPAHIVEKELAPMAVLEEMANLAVNEHVPKILVEEKIDAIGHPSISITKIAKDNPLEFTVSVAVLPEIKLPDYKKLAVEINKTASEITVTDEELDGAIKELKKAREHNEIHKSGAEHDHEEFEKREFDATLTDEYVKQLGPFENVAAFKEKFRENIKNEKAGKDREKRRIEILEKIAEGTTVELPDVLVKSELENLINRLKGDVAQAGIKWNEYLNHIKKNEDDMRKDMHPDAEKRAKMELIMMNIAKTEKLEANETEVENETKRLIQTYQDADPTKARAFITHMLINEEIFKFLESQK